MNEELKKTLAKKLVRLHAHNDGLWTGIRDIASKFTALSMKTEPYNKDDLRTLRLCLSIVLGELLVRDAEVKVSEHLTPDEEEKYGGTNP